MKNISLLVWLTQLGLSVVVPLLGFIWLGVWLNSRFDWGVWVIIACVILGLIFAIDGLRYCLRVMAQSAKTEQEDTTGISYNEHD